MVTLKSIQHGILVWLVLCASLAVCASAQAPQLVPVTAVLRDDSGALISDSALALGVALYDVESGGTALHSETTTVEVKDGVFTHLIGTGDSASPFSLQIFQSNPSLYLGLTIGDDTEATPRIRLGTVPYAAYAESAGDAETLGGLGLAELQPRISEGCGSSQAIRGFDASGAVQCETVSTPAGGSLTGVETSSASGLAGGCATGTCQLSVDYSAAQQRVLGICSSGEFMTAIGLDGSPTCSSPDLASYSTGAHFSGDYGDLANPPDLSAYSQGTHTVDTDTLANLTGCATGDVAAYNGSAWTCGYSPRRSMEVAAAAFSPLTSAEGYTGSATSRGLDAGTSLMASVHLPEGATVLDFRCGFDDKSASQYIEITLRESLPQQFNNTIATLTTGPDVATTGYQFQSTTTITNATITSTGYRNHTILFSALGGGACGSSCLIQGCNIYYTLPNPHL